MRNLIGLTGSISVIIPCYRCSSTILRAINSVISQSLMPAEIILVDDCSGDETLTILMNLEEAYSGIVKVIRMSENKGPASARNLGWSHASQDYIAFLDADDSWHPEKLQIQYTFMNQHDDIPLSGHLCSIMGDVEPGSTLPASQLFSEITRISLIFKNPFYTPSIMIKRNLPIRFDENKRYAEDFFLWQTIAFQGLRIVRLNSVLANIHKPLYGASGLSAHMWKMEIGELKCLATLFRSGSIGLVLYICSTTFSLFKFARRLLIIKARNICDLR